MISIRSMTRADRDAIISIHRLSIFGLCGDHYSEREMKAWTNFLTPELFDAGMNDTSNVGVVAMEADTLIGYGFINADAQELRGLYILPAHVKKGVGTRIVVRLEDAARDKGIRRLFLNATQNAVAFYEKMGFMKTGTVYHRLDDAISLPCVRMEKQLDGSGTRKDVTCSMPTTKPGEV